MNPLYWQDCKLPGLLLLQEWGGEGLRMANGWLQGSLFLSAWAIAWLPIALSIAVGLKWNPSQPITSREKLPLLASLYLIVPLIFWGWMGLTGATFADYGLVVNLQFLRSLGWGMGMGILGLSAVFFLESRWGWLYWHGENLPQLGKLFLPILILALAIAMVEESIFRGLFLNLLVAEEGLWQGMAFSSAIFALSHLLWEWNKTIPQLPGLVLMGAILVEARVADGGSLGLACGLHAGWVWGLTSLDAAGLISYPETAPRWAIGWGKNPLAGVAGIACLLATGWAIAVW